MLIKSKRKNRKLKVTFTMPNFEGCQQLFLVGDFNEWRETATPMKQAENGVWSVTLELEPDREYQYRYLTNDRVWHNDWAADDDVPNPYGSRNSLIVT